MWFGAGRSISESHLEEWEREFYIHEPLTSLFCGLYILFLSSKMFFFRILYLVFVLVCLTFLGGCWSSFRSLLWEAVACEMYQGHGISQNVEEGSFIN